MSSKSILFDTIRFSTRNYIFENKDETSSGSNLIGIFDNRIGIGTNLPAENYICTIDGDTLIRGNLTATSLNYITSNLSYIELNSTGGYPALDIIQTGSEPFIRMMSSSNDPTAILNVFESDGNVGIGTSIAYEKLVVNGNIVASNIQLLGTFLEKKALILKPVQKTHIVETYLQSNFSVFTEGIYDGSADNAAIYLDGYKLAYSNIGSTDYRLTKLNDYAGNHTEYVITLTRQVTYGTIVDITVWPYYLTSDTQGLQPGWASQSITSTYFSKNPNDDVYIIRNVGIGELYPTGKLHIKHLTGESYRKSIYVTNSNSEGVFVVDKDGSVGVGTNIPLAKIDVRGDASYVGNLNVTQIVSGADLRILNKIGVGTGVVRESLDVIGTSIISGNLGVGFSNPINKLAVNGTSYFACNIGIGTFNTRQLVDIDGGNMILSGSFGIGTIIPIQPFHVSGVSYFGANVGIGTTIIRQKLDVQGGDIICSGNLGIGTVSPYIPLFVTGNGYISGNLGIGTTISKNSVDIIGNTTIRGNLGIGIDSPSLPLYVTGTSYLSGNVGIGTTLPRQVMDIQGSAIISGNLGIGTTIPYIPFYVKGQTFISGNLGVGTTIPQQLLHVQGGSIFSGNIGIGTTIPRQLVDIVGGNITILGNIGIGTITPLACLDVKGGSTGIPPLLVRSGTVITTPVAGTIEYDGTSFYGTTAITHGRAFTQNSQIFRLTTNGLAISNPTVGSLFGTTSGITLAANTNYEIDYQIYILKASGTNTVTFSLLFSGASTSIQLLNATYIGSPVGGLALGQPQIASLTYVYTTGQTTFTLPTTGLLTSAVNHYYSIKVFIENGSDSGTITLRGTAAAGSIQALRGSYYKVTNFPSGNVGAFA